MTLGIDRKIQAEQIAAGVAASNLGFTPLNAANNLSDIGNAATARANLGISMTGTTSLDASNVTITAPGTGAVVRSVSTKLGQYRDVRDFGAIGDGTSHPLSTLFSTLLLAQVAYPFATALTNEIDWCAWTAAVNSLPATGGTIYAPAGQYLFDQVFVVGNGSAAGHSTITNVHIIGEGLSSAGVTYNGTTWTDVHSVQCTYTGTSTTATFWTFKGPITVAVENVMINPGSAFTAVAFQHVYSSYFKHFCTWQYNAVGFSLIALPSVTNFYAGCGNNTFDMCNVSLPVKTHTTYNYALVVGQGSMASSADMDVNQTKFNNCFLATGPAIYDVCVQLQYCDNIAFQDCFLYSNGRTGIAINVNPPTGGNGACFPQIISFNDCPTYGIYNTPSPPTWTPGPASTVSKDRGLMFFPLRREDLDIVGVPTAPGLKGVSHDGIGFGRLSTNLYDRSAAVVNVTNTIATTSVYSFSVPPLLWGTTRALKLELFGSIENNTGTSENITLDVWLGSTLIHRCYVTIPAGVGFRSLKHECTIYMRNAANLESCHGRTTIGSLSSSGGLGTMANVLLGQWESIISGLTIDTTPWVSGSAVAAMVLGVNFTLGVASTNMIASCEYVSLQHL